MTCEIFFTSIGFFSFCMNLYTSLKPLCIGGLFHYYMVDESICHFMSVGSILSLLFYFDGE